MTPGLAQRFAQVRHWSATARGMLLIAMVGLAFAVVASIGFQVSGVLAVQAAAIAAGICLGSSLLALVAFELLRRPNDVMASWGVSMGIRMALPLSFVVIVAKFDPPWAAGGLPVMLVVFYSFTLLIETWLTVPPGNSHPATSVDRPTLGR